MTTNDERTITLSFTLVGVRADVTDAALHDLLVDLLDEAVDASSQGGRIADVMVPNADVLP